ncbi:hypothetical protein GCM10029992_50890 [Glycomyces albus]
MFHRLPELGTEPTLVRSVDFAYDTEPVSGASRLVSVSTTGYRRDGDGYERQSTPPLTLRYQSADIDATVREVAAEHLPAGLEPGPYLWVDLDGEGVAGVLGKQRGAWYYLRNRSPSTTRTARSSSRLPQPCRRDRRSAGARTTTSCWTWTARAVPTWSGSPAPPPAVPNAVSRANGRARGPSRNCRQRTSPLPT